MQQAACPTVLVAGSKAEASSALFVPPLHKDVCPGCDSGSQCNSRFPRGLHQLLLCFGNSGSAALCPLDACSYGTGAMKAIKNDTVFGGVT